MTDSNVLTFEIDTNKPNFEAELDDERMYELEQIAQVQTGSDGVNRRIALAALTRSSQQMLEAMDDETAEAMLDAVECLNTNIEFLKGQIEMMTAAQARLMWVLSSYFGDDLDS